MRTSHHALLSLGLAAVVLGQASSAGELPGRSTEAGQKPAASAQAAAAGTLTVGSAKFRLSHAYAFVDKASADAAKETYRVLVTDRALSPAALKFAASAGANDEDRQQLAADLAEHDVHGVELLVGADKAVTRVNIYSPDSVLGLMLLSPGQFQATAFEPKQIAGRITLAATKDPRIGKTIQYESTFSAAVSRPAAK